ncbi:nuclear transport factor 2 family protein [Mycolicibacterium sp.]|uniref:nuclear transport factor 2 family protein n=1 Tax=Mycolicibacterium sp. TaxID=2320850 RepID=UPI001A28B779|nr:nuclear transport factor 2 family protein [Mycolicibacterium sp.]MBJ7337825.1 nuclear transport factor 2 family protein [Mycolicibacterium sp.]
MPSAELITQTVHRYLGLVAEGQPDAIAELYADDATVEDPVGGEVHIGRNAIRGFYGNVAGVKAVADVVTLRALGHEAAFFWNLTIDLGEGGKMRIDIISVMAFDGEGRITSMKAYWGPENVTQL